MGLQKSITRDENTVKGIFSAAYFKVQNIRNESGKFYVEVRGYCDKGARDLESSQVGPMYPGSGEVKIASKSYTFAEDQLPIPTIQASKESDRLKHCVYNWLKTQDDFRTATSIFEDGQNIPLE